MNAEISATRYAFTKIQKRLEAIVQDVNTYRENELLRHKLLTPNNPPPLFAATIVDSNWMHIDNDLEHYFADLGVCIPYEDVIRELHCVSSPRVIDVMATPAALRSLFYRLGNPEAKGLALSYEEGRSVEEIQRDTEVGISQLAGDINSPSIHKEIRRWLGKDKAHLILSRSVAGLENVPHTRWYLNLLLQRSWSYLSPQNGLLLIQTPNKKQLQAVGILVDEWLKALDTNGIEAHFEGEHTLSVDSMIAGILMLRKKQEMPLPSLPGFTTTSHLANYRPVDRKNPAYTFGEEGFY